MHKLLNSAKQRVDPVLAKLRAFEAHAYEALMSNASAVAALRVLRGLFLFVLLVISVLICYYALYALPYHDDWFVMSWVREMGPLEFVIARWVYWDGRIGANIVFWPVFSILVPDKYLTWHGYLVSAVLVGWFAVCRWYSGSWLRTSLIFVFPVLFIGGIDYYYWLSSSLTYIVAAALILAGVKLPQYRLYFLLAAATFSEVLAVGVVVYYFFSADWTSRKLQDWRYFLYSWIPFALHVLAPGHTSRRGTLVDGRDLIPMAADFTEGVVFVVGFLALAGWVGALLRLPKPSRAAEMAVMVATLAFFVSQGFVSNRHVSMMALAYMLTFGNRVWLTTALTVVALLLPAYVEYRLINVVQFVPSRVVSLAADVDYVKDWQNNQAEGLSQAVIYNCVPPQVFFDFTPETPLMAPVHLRFWYGKEGRFVSCTKPELSKTRDYYGTLPKSGSEKTSSKQWTRSWLLFDREDDSDPKQ